MFKKSLLAILMLGSFAILSAQTFQEEIQDIKTKKQMSIPFLNLLTQTKFEVLNSLAWGMCIEGGNEPSSCRIHFLPSFYWGLCTAAGHSPDLCKIHDNGRIGWALCTLINPPGLCKTIDKANGDLAWGICILNGHNESKCNVSQPTN